MADVFKDVFSRFVFDNKVTEQWEYVRLVFVQLSR